MVVIFDVIYQSHCSVLNRKMTRSISNRPASTDTSKINECYSRLNESDSTCFFQSSLSTIIKLKCETYSAIVCKAEKKPLGVSLEQ